MGLTPGTLWSLLGYPGGPPGLESVAIVEASTEGTMTVEAVRLTISGKDVPGTLLRPRAAGPRPALLYAHAHGNAPGIGRTELLSGRPALLSPYGPALVEAGFAVLCLDMPGFGDRQKDGPESALAKAALWRGRTLLGQMLSELSGGLDFLCRDPGIDATRLATLGISMGATHAYWLAALDPRVRACAHLCAFAEIAPLIDSGAHDLHGPYMTVPGLLAAGDMGDVAALIAPRPQLVCSGADDPLTPPEALTPALSRLRAAYAACPGALSILTEPGSGHAETCAMRDAVLSFLRHALA
ncbi:hypothetical protein N0B44_13180 [Roseibacterium beibuensis]|uniref:Alpha/beta hydrolase n=1 Tax=[Roseibacterium] beibuensis TaxID=1193142 RepID=A0ABP9L8N7_9RHOB|nr:hypothetical protein [Roseibacterium beibuensis]MCS6623868.1 hypothetical protein [Roseibacterium beibuensis]